MTGRSLGDCSKTFSFRNELADCFVRHMRHDLLSGEWQSEWCKSIRACGNRGFSYCVYDKCGQDGGGKNKVFG